MAISLIWEKTKDVTYSDWEKLKIGALVRLSRAPSRAQIEDEYGNKRVFQQDQDAFDFLEKNGFCLMDESLTDLLHEVQEKDLELQIDYLRRAISEDTKNRIPKQLKDRFPKVFG